MKLIKTILTTFLVGQLIISCNSSGSKQSNQSVILSAAPQSELITLGATIGVRQGKTIKFYDAQRNWAPSNHVDDFNIPTDAGELITLGATIGVRQGKTIKFYDAQRNWAPSNHVDDFNIPTDAGELITLGATIGVRQGKTIKFYDAQRNWAPSNHVNDFNFSN
jgi:uncharacterized protein YifN (PemK superfamily)